MLLQYAVRYQESRDWIREKTVGSHIHIPTYTLQTSIVLMQIILKAKEKGCADLTTITAASSTASSVNQDTKNVQIRCTRCIYTHPRNNCPAFGKECYKCNGTGHFTSLCRKPITREKQEITSRDKWEWSHTCLDTKDQPAKPETANAEVALGEEAGKTSTTAETPLATAHKPINLLTTVSDAAQPPCQTDTKKTVSYSTLITSTFTASLPHSQRRASLSLIELWMDITFSTPPYN